MPEPFHGVNALRSRLNVTTVTLADSGISLALGTSVQRLSLLLVTCLFSFDALAEFRLLVDLSERELQVLVDGERAERYDVAVGKDDYPTPTGQFRIRKVIWNPAWKPPDSRWARGKSATPPGHPDNPMKRAKIFFREPDYYIHGTGDEESLGRAASHGCVRMHPDDVTRVAKLVMEYGGKPMPEPWYRRIFRRKTTKVVNLSQPVSIEIRE